VLATLFVITAMLGLFISNTATAVLMAPVALAIAKDLGASPYPFAMTVALAVCSVHDAHFLAGEHAGGRTRTI
jgi:di/tricarboxylate transporter